MKNVLLYSAITIISFLIFLFLIAVGSKQKRKKLNYVAIFFLFLAIVSGVQAGFLFIHTTFGKIKTLKVNNPLRSRTGLEIYTALFGSPKQNCVEVINKMDQVVPRLDCCIWLEWKTCPSELTRIIALEPYKMQELPLNDTISYVPNYSPRPGWFNPKVLGEEITILQNYNPANPNRNQILIFSKDSTHAFYCDMAD